MSKLRPAALIAGGTGIALLAIPPTRQLIYLAFRMARDAYEQRTINRPRTAQIRAAAEEMRRRYDVSGLGINESWIQETVEQMLEDEVQVPPELAKALWELTNDPDFAPDALTGIVGDSLFARNTRTPAEALEALAQIAEMIGHESDMIGRESDESWDEDDD